MIDPFLIELLKFLPKEEALALDSELAYTFIVIYNKIVESKPEPYNWGNPDMDLIFSEFEIIVTNKPSDEMNTVWIYTGDEECNAFAFLRHIRNAISRNTISKKNNSYRVVDIYFKDLKNSEISTSLTMHLNITIEKFWPLIIRTLQSLKRTQ